MATSVVGRRSSAREDVREILPQVVGSRSSSVCFALGLHDGHRTAWVTMLATFAALPLAWAARRSGRAAKAAAGMVTA
jgi:hypothetical protein